MSIRKVCAAAVGLVLPLLLPVALPVSAHELSSDSDLVGLLHVEPDDHPIAGRTATLHFTLTHDNVGFSADDCGCVVTMSQQSKQVFRVVAANATHVTFRRAGAYDVTIAGVRDGEDFSLHFTVNVQAPSTTKLSIYNPNIQVILFSLASLAVLILIARRQIIDGRRYR